MEREKVKEILGRLHCKLLGDRRNEINHEEINCVGEVITLINELEKENDDYYERCVILRRENEQLKTLVDSLEKKNIDLEEYIKGNEQDAKAFVNGWHKDLETELKQFAERLKKKAIRRQEFIGELAIDDIEYVKTKDIDETLKECLCDKHQ
jgi:hypothetical protein